MTMLMNKDQDIYKTTVGLQPGGHLKSSSNTPSSNSKLTNSSRVPAVDLENFKKSEINLYATKPSQKKLKRDLEDYLKSSRSGGSRNHLAHTSNAHTHAHKTYR